MPKLKEDVILKEICQKNREFDMQEMFEDLVKSRYFGLAFMSTTNKIS